jgi:hypothetical protein
MEQMGKRSNKSEGKFSLYSTRAVEALFSSNESNDRKPVNYLGLMTETFIKELVKKAAIQPTQSRFSFPYPLMSSMQSPMGNYYVNPAADLQIFGFRIHVCDKCLMPEIHYVAFPNTGGGRIERYNGHYCVPAKTAATSESVDRSGMFRSLREKIRILLKQKVNSRNGNNNHLVALRLSSPHEETINLSNSADPSKPKIAFPYSQQTHVNLEPAKENKSKSGYLGRAITLRTTPLSDEELIHFLELMRNATFGVVTVHDNTCEDNSSHDSLSYFVYID